MPRFEQDIAAFIKKDFDKNHGNKWHCIVGRNFGSFVTHDAKHFIYLYRGQASKNNVPYKETCHGRRSAIHLMRLL